MSMSFRIDTIENEAGLVRLAPEWWDLWERTEGMSPFQCPAWLIAWWKAFTPGDLLTVAVRLGQRLVGLAPFYVEMDGTRRRLLPLGISISDYLDILVERDLAEPILAAISTVYTEELACWDEWELTELSPGAHALDLPCPRDCAEHQGETATCPVLLLPPSPCAIDGYYPRGKLRKLRMARHRIAKCALNAIIGTRERDAQWWLGELWRTHGTRWRNRGEAGLLSDPRLRASHGDALPQLIERGIVRLFALQLDSTVAGIYYGFGHRDRAYAYLGGFDPEFAYYSPGSILLAHAIEGAIAEGAREFHLLRGGEAYKYAWGAQDRSNRRRVFTRMTP
jgi:CelD/BcsL family acetyltransferase involved in cellulose biosynthesis